MSLTVELIHRVDQLTDRDIDAWNGLAKNPLQRWEWLGSWCEAFQSQHELCILRLSRGGHIVAFAPWCIESRLTTGRTIQFLGSGKACSDHLSLLVTPDETEAACEAITAWLISDHSDSDSSDSDSASHDSACGASDPVAKPTWDSIELIGIDKDDHPINHLVETMRRKGLTVDQTDGMGCYVIDLPSTWDDYVKMRSKSGRREIRQSLKNIDDGTIVVNKIHDEQQLDQFWEDFVRLHQRRRHESGTTGCFDHPGFDEFLRLAASRLLSAGLLEFVVATADDAPVAAQFALADKDAWYFYQSGMEPDASELRPGLSIFCCAIRETIQTGRKRFDMMRGDEPYKLRWRAELAQAQEVRVCSPRRSAQVRNQVYKAGLTFKSMVKSGLGIGQTQH